MKTGFILIGAALVVAAACGDKVCAGVPLERYPPADTTISVGAPFVLRFEEGGTCTPGHFTEADLHPVELAWTTTDTLVIQLEPTTQRVTGRRVGDATVTAAERGFVVKIHVR
jgi:hypothetical protein